MKVIESIIIDFSFFEHEDKSVFMSKEKGVYYIWCQDSDTIALIDDIKTRAHQTKDLRVAKEVYNFYVDHLMNVTENTLNR